MKRVYLFEEAPADEKLLGGKGLGLCEMRKIKLPVPPGFVITTQACADYYKKKKIPSGLMLEVKGALKKIERETGKRFGDKKNPLLVSVRSGAAVSMPGMMDTILNLGLNDEIVEGLKTKAAHDIYKRFTSMFCEICKTGKEFPSDPYKQLELAIKAVFDSWMGKRCVDYRKEFGITKEMCDGTAVNVCAMVFGNINNDSGTGVAFTRDPATGKNILYGEYLLNAQGEDIVAGTRTPKPISALKKEMPAVYSELLKVRERLERYYKEVQDFEFTIENGKLYILQTRNAKMSANAFVKTSVEMFKEGLLTKKQAILRINPKMLEQLMHKVIDPTNSAKPISKGLPASPGAASGIVVLDADEAERKGRTGEKVILVREETKPEDIHGFFTAQGILTCKGGKTSHAAVVARSIGKPCVTGAENITINSKGITIGKTKIMKGETITIDGSTGNIFIGKIKTIDPKFSKDLVKVLKWADEVRSLGVRANINTPEDAVIAKKFGAQGVGLCRTERMFNQPKRLAIMQKMILADNKKERLVLLNKLLPMQKDDFKKIFKIMGSLPVTIRLLDPPLHEFLPTVEELEHEIEHLTHLKDVPHTIDSPISSIKLVKINELKNKEKYIEKLISEKENTLRKVKNLAEVNPMLGHRGVRIGITYPEIYEMQVRAIFEAAAEVIKKRLKPRIEIMVPQVCTAQELKWVKEQITEVNRQVEERTGVKVRYKFGTMIEVVRACMRAGKLAEIAEFFSFGTNDLTQATFSFSREDAENKFLPLYNERKILQDNPFEILDIKGVGRLMMIAIEWGRKTRKNLKVGICGEHGGDPRSIEICKQVGVDYVSCSPYRLPVARLAAAHAELNRKKGF